MHARTLGTHRDSINLVVDSPALPCDPGLVVIFIILHAKQRPLDKMFCCFCGNAVEAAFVQYTACHVERKKGTLIVLAQAQTAQLMQIWRVLDPNEKNHQ